MALNTRSQKDAFHIKTDNRPWGQDLDPQGRPSKPKGKPIAAAMLAAAGLSRSKGLEMANMQSIMVSQETAAKLMELTRHEFKSLVEAGVLPRGREIAPGITRWNVQELHRIASGDLVEGMGDVDWGP